MGSVPLVVVRLCASGLDTHRRSSLQGALHAW